MKKLSRCHPEPIFQRKTLRLLLFLAGSLSIASAQDSVMASTARLEQNFRIVSNVTYFTASNYESKLDLYVTRTPEKPLPTMIWIHGGGWRAGVKENRAFVLLP